MTAVIVAHDGVTWLPQVADAVLGQTRPVQRVVAVDTGSRDRSGAVLASKFGQAAVFGMDRSTGYGAAISRALQHRAAKTPVPAASGSAVGSAPQAGERTEWLWLLHDDCEPAPDALEQLLRGTVETSSAAVLGPKIRDWNNREVILEAGVTVDSATRRVTGIEPREIDQGQHDGDRDSLAVSSAGLLVRRDVWEQVGGFDAAMGLFMDDIDFCWRVHAAGYRVRVITEAIVYHVQAATKHKRPVSVGRRARMLERRNGLLALLGNLPARPMLRAAAGNVMVSLLRITFFLLAKRLAAAVDELSALVSVLCHPIRLIKMRSQRARGRRAAYSRVRADLPPGHSGRKVAEFVLGALSKSQADTSGSHHATDDPAEDDSMLVDNGLGKRLLTSPTLLTIAALTGISLAACRSLIGVGPLGGGSLVPAWGGSGSLWASYVQTFHPSGLGSTTPAPPWLAVIAALATVLGGKPWLAIDVLLIGCVPLSGMTAMFAVRKVTTSGLVRVWAAVTYALLPVAIGVIAAGRFGTAVVFVLLPLIVSQAGRMLTQGGPRAARAAWATGLLLALGGAFVPLLWVLAVLACVLAALVLRARRRGLLRNLAIVAITPPVLLMPWALTLISNPSGLVLEAGLPQSGAPAFSLPARSLLLLSPGGPGLPPYWVTGGLLLVAFAALFAGRRRRLVVAGWCIALCGLLAGVLVSHLIVRPADGGAVTVWAGLPLALAAIGLLIAAAAAADGLGRRAGGSAGWRTSLGVRGPVAVVLGLVACSAPALAAASWLSTGVSGPLHRVSSPLVPELVAAADGQHRQVRTLVLRSTGGHISYLLLRGPSPSLADSALTPPAAAERALSKVVSALTTPGGNLAANQTQLLAEFDIGFVMVQAPVDAQLTSELNSVSGLRPYSTGRYTLWQLDTAPSRVAVREPGGSVVPVASGTTGVAGVAAPAAGGTLMLTEPAGGWRASLNGHPLAAVPSPAGSWAQAFRLPKGGGTLTVTHSGLSRDLLLILELVLFLIVVALALPGIHVAEQEAAAAAKTDQPSRRSGRAAGRGSGAVPAQRVAGGAGPGALARAGARPAAADQAGARTGVLDPLERADSELSTGGRISAGRGPGGGLELAGAGLAGAGLAGAGLAAARAAARRGAGPDDGDETDTYSAADTAADAPASRRRLARAGRGKAAQSGRGTRGRGARGRDARQRTGLTKGTGAAKAATETWTAGGDQDDSAETTMLAAESGAEGRGRRGDSRRGRRDSSRSNDLDSRTDSREARAEGRMHRTDDRAGRLADAWPYQAESDRPDGKLADAWPYDRGEAEAGPRAGRHGFRTGEDIADDPLGPGWRGESRGRGRSYAEEPSGFPGRGTGNDRGYPDYDLDYGRAEPFAGSRSPSGQSPGVDWPYSELDAPAGRDRMAHGRSPSGRAPDDSWPGLDTPSGGRRGRPAPDGADELPPWRTDQGTRAYRLSGPGTGPQRAIAPRDDLRDDSPGGRDRTARGRHGAQRPDEPAGWGPDGSRDADDWATGPDPLSWPGAGADELEPLPPLDRPGPSGRGYGPPSRSPVGEDTGDWARFDEAEDGRWNPAAADYEPEYEGDSW